jgi:putative chitinase
MIDDKFLFDNYPYRPISPLGVITCQAIIKRYTEDEMFTNLRQLAYVFATALHESAHTLDPGIREYGRGRGRRYGLPYFDSELDGKGINDYDGRGLIFYGRGLSQLTWWYNYDKMHNLVGTNYLKEPDLALQAQDSVDILMEGMIKGIFTGHKLTTFFNDSATNWVKAREVVNGLDCANLIGGYAQKFYTALRYTDDAYNQDNENDKGSEEKDVSEVQEFSAKSAIYETTWDGNVVTKKVEMPDGSIAEAYPVIDNIAA